MRVALDARFLLPHLEGFGRFTYEVGRRLVKLRPEWEWDFLVWRPLESCFYFGENQRVYKLLPPTRHWFLQHIWLEYSVPWYARRHNPHIFWGTYGVGSLRLAKKIPLILFVHDIAFMRLQGRQQGNIDDYLRCVMPRSIRAAQVVLANSQSVAQDLQEVWNVPSEKIRIAYSGFDAAYFSCQVDKEKVWRTYTQGVPYVLYVGSIHPRKNAVRLIEAYDLLRQVYRLPLKLLFVGRFMGRWWGRTYRQAFLRRWRQSPWREDIIFHPPVSDEELKKLYAACEVFVYPSLYEGFGYPVLEAMGCGALVAASGVSSIPEVGGKAAIYFDPYNPQDMAEKIYNLLSDSGLQKSLRLHAQKQIHVFTWERTAEVFIREVESL